MGILIDEVSNYVMHSGGNIRKGNGELHDFYSGAFHYWHLSVEDYMECRSDRQISAKRLKALDKIVDPVLQSVAARVKNLQTAGYQEGLIKRYQEDILQLR